MERNSNLERNAMKLIKFLKERYWRKRLKKVYLAYRRHCYNYGAVENPRSFISDTYHIKRINICIWHLRKLGVKISPFI